MAKSDRKQPVDSGVGLLEVRLGAALSCPTRRLVADLEHVGLQVARAKTAMVRAFERWHEDHPGYDPGAVTRKDGAPCLLRGRPRPVNQPLPARMPVERELKCRKCKGTGALSAAPCPSCDGRGSKSWIDPATWLYHVGRRASPDVDATVMASCSKAVWAALQAELPWNHHGASAYRWQAIVNHEAGPGEVERTVYRSLAVPAPNSQTVLGYVGAVSRELPAKDARRVADCSASSAVARFCLFSEESGRGTRDAIVRVEARQLTPGNRNVLRRVASGEWKMRDSALVYKEGKGRGKSRRKAKRNGAWFLQLCYHQPRVNLGLDPNREAVVEALPPDAGKPFRVECGPACWGLGAAAMLEREALRLDARRRALRERFAVTGHGRRGHGRQRVERDIRPITRAVRDLVERFIDGLVAEVVRFCVRFNAGSVLYREPGVRGRERSWFAGKGLFFDWTNFWMKLSQKCAHHGIELRKERPAKAGRAAAGV
ncbi:MAG TPA: hypothetical protein VEA69_00200 [Tepidisphaeraceae bacterium]|nr:hypothetical protein [Tepidisphaeraceae bacterium]